MPTTPDSTPIAADEMADAFREHLLEAGADLDTTDAPLVWRAFVAFAARPITPGASAPNANEDLLMFDVYTGDDSPPYLRLVRSVSLADEQDDHIDTAVFECVLFYERRGDIAALEDGAMWASFDPDRSAAETVAFIDEVELSEAYRTLIERHKPSRIRLSP